MELEPEIHKRLSPIAREALRVNSAGAFGLLVVRGPGDVRAAELLGTLTPANVLSVPPRSHNDSAAVLSALWLWHDCLDQSHDLSQAIHTPTGSYLHAIMHRREGDFWNSKYWLNKCGGHPALATIGRHAADIINAAPADKSLLRLTLGEWDAGAFVDLAEQVHDSPDDPRHGVAVALQRVEWRVLFESCVRSGE